MINKTASILVLALGILGALGGFLASPSAGLAASVIVNSPAGGDDSACFQPKKPDCSTISPAGRNVASSIVRPLRSRKAWTTW